MDATEPVRYILTQVAHMFSVSVNKSHSIKRDCMIAGCVLCINQAVDENPLTIFLPQFKILFKNRSQHFTIFLISKLTNYKLTIRLKSKKEGEITQFYQALVIARASYENYVVSQCLFDVVVHGKEQDINAFLIIFDDSFEVQDEDGVLLYDDSIMNHPDVFASTADPLVLNVSRNDETRFSFQCVDMQELVILLFSLNKDGPAVKRTKKKKSAKKEITPVQSPMKEMPQSPSLDFDDETGLESISESMTELAMAMTFDESNVASEQAEIARTTKFDDLDLLKKNRSAFRHMRESIYKVLFQKKRTKYGKGVEPVKIGTTIQQTSEFEFVPDVELHDDMKIASKNYSSFEQMMESKLKKFESYQNSFSAPKMELQTITSVISSYRAMDPLIKENPLPILENLDELPESSDLDILRGMETAELFQSIEDSPYPVDEEDFPIETCLQYLSVSGIDVQKCKLEVSPTDELPNLREMLFKEIEENPTNIPAIFASVLLHRANNIPNIYNSLTCILFHTREIDEVLNNYPFATFSQCCTFFYRLIKYNGTKTFFSTLGRSYMFLADNYKADALIRIQGICDELANVETNSESISVPLNATPIKLFSSRNYAKVVENEMRDYEMSPTISWLAPVEKTNPIINVIKAIVDSYSYLSSQQNILWDKYIKALSEYTKDNEELEKELVDIIKGINEKSKNPSYKLAAFIFKLLVNKKFSLWYISTWKAVVNPYDKMNGANAAVAMTVSLIKFQNALSKEPETAENIDIITNELATAFSANF